MDDRPQSLKDLMAWLAAQWTIPDAADIHRQDVQRRDFEDTQRRQREAQERAGDA